MTKKRVAQSCDLWMMEEMAGTGVSTVSGLWEGGAPQLLQSQEAVTWIGCFLRALKCPSFPSPRAQLKLHQESAFKGCLKCGLKPKIYRASAFVTLLKMFTEEN